MVDFTFRKAELKDADSLSLLYKKVWDEQKDLFPDELLRARQPNYNEMKKWLSKETYFICEVNENIIGVVGCCMEFGNCKLVHMAVLKEYRRMGIGSKLLEKVEQYAKKKSALKIWMDTSTRLIEAIEFYQKKKYRIVGELQKHFWGEDIILLEKIM